LGRKRFKALLRRHAQYTASDILNAIFAELDDFSKGRKPEDDITLVIIKIQQNR
jgi:sigma-B regulation protein RsbU (phosphoserine phosphatase)